MLSEQKTPNVIKRMTTGNIGSVFVKKDKTD